MEMEDNFELQREQQEDGHTSAICKERAMFIQLARSVIVLVDMVILAQRVTQGWDDIGFMAPACLLLFSRFGASLGYSLLLVTSFTPIILCLIISIKPCCKGLWRWYHQMVSPWLE
jgi:hypothetical protein